MTHRLTGSLTHMKLYIYRSKGLYINKIWGWEREREWDWGTEDNLSDDDPSEIIDVDNQDESINQNLPKLTKLPMMECANVLATFPDLWGQSQLPPKQISMHVCNTQSEICTGNLASLMTQLSRTHRKWFFLSHNKNSCYRFRFMMH